VVDDAHEKGVRTHGGETAAGRILVSDTKEFQGKNLDEAIEAACKHFDLKRDKLEIEIISGGSSGIFGLVGVKKAAVRAKPRGSFKAAPEPAPAPEPQERLERQDKPQRQERPHQKAEPAPSSGSTLPADSDAQPGNEPGGLEQQGEARRSERSRRGRGRGRSERSPERSDKPAERSADQQTEKSGEAQAERAGARAQQPRRRERSRRDADQRPPRREPQAAAPGEDEDNGAPQGIGHLDQAKLEEVAREVTQKLLMPLVENAQVSIELLADRVCVKIEDPDNTGLLIGREGQTLASIQYLVNRLVSKRMDASVRVQIDAGDYRENQDERLRQIARHLADKATNTGRTQSTRPMSSYHRRVVHLTLQDDEFVFTRSKGEGSMKRVLIMPKRKGKDGELLEGAENTARAEATQDFSESAGE
jgi:spoIIIJ-associated protein